MELSNDQLGFDRLTCGELHLQSIDLLSVLEESLRQLNFQLQEQQTEVMVGQPLNCVLADRPLLIQVVTHLISNAIRFVSAQPSSLQIYSQEEQGWVRLWFADNGIGIAPEHQERIFGRLPSSDRPGTGAGLAIVRQGMERMGGQVGVESQLGQGSRFWIELPAA
ncbi:MAG TPA: HAMP domain-containing sensor histidine kinase [Thermosynechococcaceae cyanobacterium]